MVPEGRTTMPKENVQAAGKANDGSAGQHIQVFLYRVPRKNHDAFGAVEGKLAEIFRRHGMVRTDLYVLGEGRVFGGFRALGPALGTTADEEVWVEIDTYRDAADSLRVIAGIGKDAAAGPLFRQVLEFAAPGILSLQGDADRVGP